MASVIAGADIAYVATVGAAGLALAVSAWAWRLDARARRSEAALEAELEARADLIATRDACLALMREVRVQILGNADGELRAGQVFGDPDLIATLTQADQAAGDVLIARVRDADAARLKALVQSGVAFDLALQTDAGVWRIEGRALAGSAWLRFTDAEISAGLGTGESAAGLLADASPVPTWVVDSTGRLAWANRAWLAAVKAGSLEDALQRQLTFDRGAEAIVADALRQGTRQEGFRWTATDGRRKAWRVLAEPSVGGGAVTAF
ncbi:MAG TPA: two-component sensor histidine kinase, partial [Brevundimonas sp.]|nr:two-component sensor histidine kinase [Brevundimonas sp.]